MVTKTLQTCLITGAGGYIGQYLIKHLVEHNWSIIGLTTNAKLMSSNQIKYVYADLNELENIQLTTINLDAIIHCAGYSPDFNILKLTDIEFLNSLNINFNGVVKINHLLKNLLKPNSHILHFGSRVSLLGNHGQIAYSTAKGLLVDYTKQLAAELGSIPIKVNTIFPGVHPSNILGKHSETVLKNAQKNSYLNQLTSISDVVNCVDFLLNSNSISGQIFSIESRPI